MGRYERLNNRFYSLDLYDRKINLKLCRDFADALEPALSARTSTPYGVYLICDDEAIYKDVLDASVNM